MKVAVCLQPAHKLTAARTILACEQLVDCGLTAAACTRLACLLLASARCALTVTCKQLGTVTIVSSNSVDFPTKSEGRFRSGIQWARK